MTDVQNTFFQMAGSVKAFLEPATPVWQGTHSFASPYGLLKNNVINKMAAATAKQQTSSTGVTIDKKASRKLLEAHLESLAGAVEAFAIDMKNNTLERDAHLTHSDITHATDDELLGMEKRISALANANMEDLDPFGVTGARILALDTDATTFAGWVGQPRATRAYSKEGTTELDNLVELGRQYLDAMDGQMILFKESAPDFYNQYFSVRKLVPTGSRPRAIYITVKDAGGHSLPGVVVSIPALNIKRVTSANGNCFVQHAAPGAYEAMLTKAGYQPLNITLHVSDGETAHAEPQMTAQ